MAFPLGLIIQLALQLLSSLKDAGIFDHKSVPPDHPATAAVVNLATAQATDQPIAPHIISLINALP